MTGIWAAIWPAGRTAQPRYRHYFDECEAAEFGHTTSHATSLCKQTFDPFAEWFHGKVSEQVTEEECPACRARLDQLEGR